MELLDRFLNYVRIHTTSDEESTTRPSTKIQLVLAKLLKKELIGLGLKDACIEDGVVYAHLKSNCDSDKKIGFIAHMDTSPEASGENVNPQIINNYNGEDITLKNGTTIPTADFPRLKELKGQTLITTDGNTLLGADDKAGVAEIMSMLEEIITNNIPHHNISIAFTPDEEIGSGADGFNLKLFDADFAYTVDGGKYDEFSCENFNAAKAVIEIKGIGIHPGEAKDKMVNAVRIAAEFDTLLPEGKRPEYTDGYDGFNHLISIEGEEVHSKMTYIIRAFDMNEFNELKESFMKVKNKLLKKYPKAIIDIKITDQYSNMKNIIDNHKEVVDLAINAMKEENVTPIISPIRGGTDGARLTFMGLPTPNMPTGGYNYHGIREYASLDEMIKCRNYLINIAKK